MKKYVILVLIVLLTGALLVGCTPVVPETDLSRQGPTNAGGESLFVPFNPTAQENSLLQIMPLVQNLGSETIIYEDGVTITVSEIPQADCDWDAWECVGTWIQLKWSRAWEAATYVEAPYYTGEWTKQAWSHYKFWLNGFGPVTITREYNGISEPEIEYVNEFIFFKVQWVGINEGNSNFTVDGSFDFDIKIQAYK